MRCTPLHTAQVRCRSGRVRHRSRASAEHITCVEGFPSRHRLGYRDDRLAYTRPHKVKIFCGVDTLRFNGARFRNLLPNFVQSNLRSETEWRSHHVVKSLPTNFMALVVLGLSSFSFASSVDSVTCDEYQHFMAWKTVSKIRGLLKFRGGAVQENCEDHWPLG